MSCLYDVAVVGAGPAGSHVARLLAAAGHRVLVLDRRRSEAVAPPCTGIVGLPYVELIGADEDVILTRASAATFVSPAGVRLRVSSPDVQACVLDRALLERRLRGRAAAAGAELCEGVTVSRLARKDDVFEVRGLWGDSACRWSCRSIVLASGVSPGLVRQAGLAPPGRYLVGAHAETDMDGVPETEVHMLPDLAPGAFAWLVPVGPGRVRVGVLCSRSAATLARRFLERPNIRERLPRMPELIAQRPVPISTPHRTYADGVVVVGDAAGQVKPTTGGGLYFGACAAVAAADVVGRALATGDLTARTLSVYERRWRMMFGRELRYDAAARGLYRRLSSAQVDRIIARADRTDMAQALLRSSRFSFDWHGATLLLGLLSCAPSLFGRRVAAVREAGR